jgi:1,4-alpha-glucan branching enzyme
VEIADPMRCALAFLRLAKGRRPALVVANLSARAWEGWRVGVPMPGKWRAVAHSDDERFDGRGEGTRSATAEAEPRHDMEQSIVLDVPPLSVSWWMPPRVRTR